MSNIEICHEFPDIDHDEPMIGDNSPITNESAIFLEEMVDGHNFQNFDMSDECESSGTGQYPIDISEIEEDLIQPEFPEVTNVHPFFKNAKIKVASSIQQPDVPKEPSFYLRKQEREGIFFNSKIFAQHWKATRSVTAVNLPCSFRSLSDYLQDCFPLHRNSLWDRYKVFSTQTEMKLKAFICAIFPPIELGSKSAKYVGLKESMKFPQFTLADSKSVIVKCESFCIFSARKNNKIIGIEENTSPSTNRFRQIYKHYISIGHLLSLKWLQERDLQVKTFFNQETSAVQKPITSFFNVINSKRSTQCFYV